MISEKCKTTYAKLNTFVTNVINRDVTPQLTNLNNTTTSLQETKLAKGDWTTLSNTDSYVTTKADMVTKNAWTIGSNSPQIMKVEYLERQYQNTSGILLSVQVTCDVSITSSNIVAETDSGANTAIGTVSGSDNMMICSFGVYETGVSDTFNITLKNNNGVITDTYSFSHTFGNTNSNWVDTGYVNVNGETVVTQTSITALENASLTYINNTNKKIKITLTCVSGFFVINGNTNLTTNYDRIYILNPNQSISVISQTSSTLNYTVGTQSNIISSIIDVAYPVGSIYISSNTTHPSIIFGGVWEHFAEDKFLLSAGSTYANGSTGGSADAVVVKHNHTQNPHNHTQNAHNHTANSDSTRSFLTAPTGSGWNEIQGGNISGSGYHYVATPDKSNYNVWGNQSANTTATNQAQTATNKEAGEDGTGKNMPPYLAVYMWKRVG